MAGVVPVGKPPALARSRLVLRTGGGTVDNVRYLVSIFLRRYSHVKLTNAQRKAIYRRDGYQCALCGSTRHLQIHHYIPRGKGGRDIPQNLITLCSDCHALVHGFNAHDYPDMTPESVEQAIVEYLADYYAPDWYPWEE